MTVTIHHVRTHVDVNGGKIGGFDSGAPHGLIIHGETTHGRQNVQVYFEIPANGVQSTNMRAVSDDMGNWQVIFPGEFRAGTEVTAYARGADAPLAWRTEIL